MKLDRFINRPVLSTVISILIVILGVIGLVSLPIEQYPDIAPPQVNVSTMYSGADAQTINNSVIAPLEDVINGVEGMDYMVSRAANNGSATITVYFNQGSSRDMAAVNVQNAVATATALLPADVSRNGVTTKKRQSSTLMMFGFYSPDDRFDEKFVENYMRINIVPVLQRIEGVGEVNVIGTNTYAFRLWLRPEDMYKHKLVPSDITTVLAEQNIEAAPGKLGERSEQAFQYTLRYKGRLKTQQEFENIIIANTQNGQQLLLKDVADVELGAQNYNIRQTVNGHKGAMASIYQLPGSNATEVIKNCEKALKEAEKHFPAGLDYAVLQSSNDFLFASIRKVLQTLIEAFLLVFIVVYIFLQDFRSTLIPAIAIPVALVGTFFFLKIMGFSLNLLTLFALVLAIAIVVDDAIVVVEAVHAKLDANYRSARQASIDAMSEIGGAIVSITLVMAAVFVPVSFISGTAGIFFRQFGLTLAVAILISAVNALTLSPALCALFLRPHREDPLQRQNFIDRFHTSFNVFFGAATTRYKKGVNWFIHHRYLSAALVVGFMALFLVLLRTTPTGLVPNEDNGVIMMGIELPPATTLEKTRLALNKADSLVRAIPEVNHRNTMAGYGFISGSGTCYGQMVIRLKNWSERKRKDQSLDALKNTIQARVSAAMPEAKILIFSPPMIPGFSANNGFELSLQDKTGGDMEHFYAVAQEFLAALSARPEIRYAATSYSPAFPQYMVEVDVDKAKRAGTSPSEILSVMQGYFGGLYVSNFNKFGKLYRVMIQASPEYTLNEESLHNCYVRCEGEMVPLTQFIRVEKVYGSEVLNRFNLFNSIPVNGQPADGYSSGQAIAAIGQCAREHLPQGFGYEFSGLTRNEQQSGNTMGIVLVVSILFVYLLLCIQYESYLLPLAALLSLPFGLCGTFIFARMMGLSNNIYLQLSLIMLIGLLCKNAILIIQFALQRREKGMSIGWAAMAGAQARFRPILMTSLALIVGLLPLMFATGAGSNGNRTIGAGAIGGMLIGMIFQLFIVPVLFVVFQTLQERVKPPKPQAGADSDSGVKPLLDYLPSSSGNEDEGFVDGEKYYDF